MNISLFYLAKYPPSVFENPLYRGEPCKLHMKTAIAYASATLGCMMELLERQPATKKLFNK